ncbi:HAD family phosphatase [bacterium]|nr:HAD family phosphatase [bacterium]
MNVKPVQTAHLPKTGRRRKQAAEAAAGPQDQLTLSRTEKSSVKASFLPSQRVQYDVASGVTRSLVPVLFLSDLDGTWLSPDPVNRKALDQGVVQLKQEAAEKGVDLQFGYISARPMERIQLENLPASDWAIANNGGYIYYTGAKDVSWEDHKRAFGFNAARAFEIAQELLKNPKFAGMDISSVGQVVGNPAADACPESASICIHNGSVRLARGENKAQMESDGFKAPAQVQAFAEAISRRLRKEGAEFQLSPVYPFHGKPYVMFDLASVNKGDAIAYLKDKENLPAEHIIIAGDGGNDIAMMLDQKGQDDGRRAIVVGENSKLREAAQGVSRAIIQKADEDCSLGVLQGLRQHVEEIIAQVNS